MRNLTIFPVLIACLTAPSIHAASFDCSVASTKIEKRICSDSNLSRLDDELSKSYKRAMQNSNHKQALQAQQRAWLEIVRNRGFEFALDKIYRERIELLNSKNPLVTVPTGTFNCEANVTTGVDEVVRHLKLSMKDGKIVQFQYWGTLAPDSPDLRPGFHYHTSTNLYDPKGSPLLIIVEASGFLAIQSRPNSWTPADEHCDIILTKHDTMLYVYTNGCERLPPTDNFQFTFSQTGSVCELLQK